MTTYHHRSNLLHVVAFMALSAGFFGFLASASMHTGDTPPHTASAALTVSPP